jgi:hypothetical protein
MTTNIDTIALPLPIWVPSATTGGGLFSAEEGREGHPVCAIIAQQPADEDREFAEQKLFVEFGTGNQYTLQELGEAYGDISWKADIGIRGEIDGQYAPYETENQRIARDALAEAEWELRQAKTAEEKAAATIAVAQAQLVIAQTDAVTQKFMDAR